VNKAPTSVGLPTLITKKNHQVNAKMCDYCGGFKQEIISLIYLPQHRAKPALTVVMVTTATPCQAVKHLSVSKFTLHGIFTAPAFNYAALIKISNF